MSTEQKQHNLAKMAKSKAAAASTKERLGTIPRQASQLDDVSVAPVKRNDGPARAAKAIVGLSITATLGALTAAGLAGVGGGSSVVGAYGSMAAPTATERVAGFPISSGSLRLDGLMLRPEGFTNDFDGAAKLTWTGAQAITGKQTFSIGITREGREVGTLTGSVANVAPGRSATVHISSTVNYVSGPLQFSLDTAVPTLNRQGTGDLLNGLSMLENMRREAALAVGDAAASKQYPRGPWRMPVA